MSGIETGIPIPGVGVVSSEERSLILELYNAEVGASIFFPLPASAGEARMRRDNIRAKCFSVGGSGWVVIRKVEGGVRVWKIK